MPTQEDRIAALEQTTVSRIDFIDAINRLTLQQAQMASDMSHQVTILLGVTGSQGQDIRTIKGDVSVLKGDVSVLKGDVSVLKGDVSALKGDVSALTEQFGRLETRFDEHTSLLTQILARLPEKP